MAAIALREFEDRALRNGQDRNAADFAEQAARRGFALIGRRRLLTPILVDAVLIARTGDPQSTVSVRRMGRVRRSHDEQERRHEDRKRTIDRDRH